VEACTTVARTVVALGSAPPFISTSLITGPAPEPEVTRAIRVGGEACYCHLLGVDAEVGGRAELRGARGRCALSAGVVSLGFLDWRGAGGRGRLELEEERSITTLLGFSVFSITLFAGLELELEVGVV